MPSGCRRSTALGRVDPELSPYVVVATQGIWDEEALAAALRRDVSYVGLVASPTRAGVVRAWLRDEANVPEERLAALRAPAASTSAPRRPRRSRSRSSPSWSRSGADARRSSPRPGPATLAGEGAVAGSSRSSLAPVVDDIVLLDPVCGMTVDREHARHLAEHDGVVYAFCSMGCRTAFIKEPGAYVPGPPALDPRRAPDRDPSPETRMQFKGTVDIAAPRDTVWAFLMDPEPGGELRAGRGIDRGRRRGPLQGEGEGRDRVHLARSSTWT